MALSRTTQDHDEIQQWAESRGAKPAEVASTESSDQTGILRLEFPNATNANDSALKEISWDEFFEKFDASGLALVYQEETAGGEKSNFNKLIYPEDSKSQSTKKIPAKKSSAKTTGAKSTGSRSSGASSTRSKTPAKSASAKAAKAPANKAAAKKTPAKKSSAKTSTKKASTKKVSAKKTPAKKSPAKKSGSKSAGSRPHR